MLLVLAGVADRAGAALAGRALAAELQRSGGLASRPSVDVAGVPFLTQAVRGRYRRIDVEATSVPAGEVVLQSLTVQLSGVRVPLSAALSGSLDAVPVDRVDATAVLAYADLARRARNRELTVSPAGDDVRVRGVVRVLGQELSASALSSLTVDGDEVVVTARSFEVGNVVADRVLTQALRDRLDFRFRLRALPYGLTVSGVDVRPEGVALAAVARDTVLTGP